MSEITQPLLHVKELKKYYPVKKGFFFAGADGESA